MHELEVRLETVNDGLLFAALANNFVADVDLKRGRIQIDGKSIVGISSLAYPCQMIAVFHCDKPKAIKLFDTTMKQFSPKCDE